MDQVTSLPLKFELRLRLWRLTRTTISKRRRTPAERMMSVMNQSDWYIDELSSLPAIDDKKIMRQRMNSRYSIIRIHSFMKVSKDGSFWWNKLSKIRPYLMHQNTSNPTLILSWIYFSSLKRMTPSRTSLCTPLSLARALLERDTLLKWLTSLSIYVLSRASDSHFTHLSIARDVSLISPANVVFTSWKIMLPHLVESYARWQKQWKPWLIENHVTFQDKLCS